MSADRKLLELAAKAAGIELRWPAGDGYAPVTGRPSRSWNPLDDDVDSRRLEVALNIEVRFHLAGPEPSVTATCAADSRVPVMREPWCDDKAAATRRAIVRAAAEIGRAMP